MNWKMLLFIPAVVLGVLGYRQLQPDEERNRAPEASSPRVLPVEGFVLSAYPVEVNIEGYGRVEPQRTWEAVSQVDGRVLSTTDDLAVGTLVEEATTLLTIDPRPYEIARDRAEANLEMANAQLRELDAQAVNVQGQLELEQRIEQVIQTDVNRQRELLSTNSVAQSSFDQTQRDLITQQRRVLDLQNQLDLIPVQRISAEATKRTRQVELEQTELDLANTVIVAPFAGRVLIEDVAEGEYIRPGDRLLTLVGLNSVEIVAEVQPSEFRTAMQLLLPDIQDTLSTLYAGEQDIALGALKRAGFSAKVKLAHDQEWNYPGEIVRLSGTVDEATGAIGIVVRVDQSLMANVNPPRPPLANGAFVSVEFTATTPQDLRALPNYSVHMKEEKPFVYIADNNNQLAIREFIPYGVINDQVIVKTGLVNGDRIILSIPEPAITGQPVAWIDASETTDQ